MLDEKHTILELLLLNFYLILQVKYSLLHFVGGILPFNSEIKEGPTIPGLSGDLGKGKKKKKQKKHKEEREGEKVKKEKSETGEQEVNMEGATSMFSEESTEGAVQETEKTAPQVSGTCRSIIACM